jgi:hypothetical protein
LKVPLKVEIGDLQRASIGTKVRIEKEGLAGEAVEVLGSIVAMVVVIGVVNVEDPILTLWWWCLG